jgi:hypothetical protein
MIPDKFTFVQVIKACSGLGTLGGGRLVHEQFIQSGCESDVFVGSSLVDMYANVGTLRMLQECSTRCHILKMRLLGQPSYLGTLKMLQECSTRCHILKCGYLDGHHIGTCAIQARAEGTGTILTNATEGCATKVCSFCGGAECMCQHGCG